MKHFLLTASLVLFAGGALAQSATESIGVNSALGVAPKTEDFIMEASASDVFEIESSKLALTKGLQDIKISNLKELCEAFPRLVTNFSNLKI